MWEVVFLKGQGAPGWRACFCPGAESEGGRLLCGWFEADMHMLATRCLLQATLLWYVQALFACDGGACGCALGVWRSKEAAGVHQRSTRGRTVSFTTQAKHYHARIQNVCDIYICHFRQHCDLFGLSELSVQTAPTAFLVFPSLRHPLSGCCLRLCLKGLLFSYGGTH